MLFSVRNRAETEPEILPSKSSGRFHLDVINAESVAFKPNFSTHYARITNFRQLASHLNYPDKLNKPGYLKRKFLFRTWLKGEVKSKKRYLSGVKNCHAFYFLPTVSVAHIGRLYPDG